MFRNLSFTHESFSHTYPISLFIKEQCGGWSSSKRILCLGDKEGSHALFLAQNGIHVEVLELSNEGVFDIYKHASPHCIDMKLCHTTLEHWKPTPFFDGIVCTFVHVSKKEQLHLFEKCCEALYPGGILVAELFSESQKSFQSGGPKELEKLYNLNQTLRILKTLPFSIDKFSQEIIPYGKEEAPRAKASVLHIVATKTTS